MSSSWSPLFGACVQTADGQGLGRGGLVTTGFQELMVRKKDTCSPKVTAGSSFIPTGVSLLFGILSINVAT